MPRIQLCNLIICDAILVIDVVIFCEQFKKFYELVKECFCISRALGLGKIYHRLAHGADVVIL